MPHRTPISLNNLTAKIINKTKISNLNTTKKIVGDGSTKEANKGYINWPKISDIIEKIIEKIIAMYFISDKQVWNLKVVEWELINISKYSK